MSAADTLRALVHGDGGAVLGACRLESGGADVFGGEAVGDAFRRARLARDDAEIVAATAGIALFAAGEAVFADVYGPHIGRLWRVGQVDPGSGEPAVSVAFDPDLAQARAAVLFAASDHPELAGDAVEHVDAAGRAIIADAGFFRARAFVVRAFGDARRGVALFAVHSLAAGPVRTPGLALAAALWDGDMVRIVRDPFPARADHVRIVG